MWNVGLGLLKLVAPVIPNVSEEFYQQYFRDREGSPSIHTLPWPEPLASLSGQAEEKEKATRKGKHAKK
jgi:valyl-tRNA synthetase